MVKVRFEPMGVETQAPAGSFLLDAALEAGVHINASCGGKGVCGKCRIVVKEGSLEGGLTEKINAKDREKGVRQACLATLKEDVVIEVPVESALDKAALKALATGQAQGAKLVSADDLKAEDRFFPALIKRVISAPAPTLEDNRNDVRRLLDTFRESGERHFALDFEAIRDLSRCWREGDWTITTTILRPVYLESGRNRIIKVEPGDTTDQNLAVAIDLGTTTVWGQLIDLNSGEILATEGTFNSQISFGEDVISRIIAADKPQGLHKLQEAAACSINSVLESLLKKPGVEVNDVGVATLAGNTTMTQLFLEMPPKYIRLEPYVPTAAYYPPLKASDFALALPDHCQLLAFPAVASYVGGDVVSGILGVGMHKDPRLTLYIDLGTNGEVVVGNQDWMACAAASAGPAFEGGGVKFGMRASQGAIENISINPLNAEPALVTVGRASPKGICGSGLIATVAALFLGGLMDERGRFNLEHDSDRLREGEDGPEYVLAWAQDTQIDRDITLTELDVDNLMRAKGAMYAAYMTLLEGVGLSIKDLDRVILAGGFGQSINIERAIIIGLLPELPPERFTFVGNGSLLGARLITMSNQLRAEVGDIVDKMTNFELSVAPGYMDNLTGSLFLPHTEGKRLFPQTRARLDEARAALQGQH
jgi:uncharacterized 2Fe-2S/4Fe-4S cluster protein (DUF4445 family)